MSLFPAKTGWTEIRNAADRQNADQSCQNIDTVFEKLMESVCSLKQDIGALQRLKKQLLVHAQQTDIDLQSLHDYHNLVAPFLIDM